MQETGKALQQSVPTAKYETELTQVEGKRAILVHWPDGSTECYLITEGVDIKTHNPFTARNQQSSTAGTS